MSQQERPANDNRGGNVAQFVPAEFLDELEILSRTPPYAETTLVFEEAAESVLHSGVVLGIDHEGIPYLSWSKKMSPADVLLMLERAKLLIVEYADGLWSPAEEDEDADSE